MDYQSQKHAHLRSHSTQCTAEGYRPPPVIDSPQQLGRAHYTPVSLYHHQHSTFDDVQREFEKLISCGLSKKQIRELCKPTHFNALALIANADEDVVRSIFCRQRDMRQRPQSFEKAYHRPCTSIIPALNPNPSQSLSYVDVNSSTIGSALTDAQHQPPMLYSVSDESPEASRDPLAFPRANTAGALMPISADCARTTNFDFPISTNQHTYEFCKAALGLPTPQHYTGLIPSNLTHTTSHFATNMTLTQSKSSIDDPKFLDCDGQTMATKKEKIRFPCPEQGCPKMFSSHIELSKHLTGDHDKSITYECACRYDEQCTFKTHRSETWKRHHSTRHALCFEGQNCLGKVPNEQKGQKMFWGCAICCYLCKDVRSYAEHHKNHFEVRGAQRNDIKFPMIIRSLLEQAATKEKWMAMCERAGMTDEISSYRWQSSTCAEIRNALEYGRFRGDDIVEPTVTDELLREILNLVSGPSLKRHASYSPDLRAKHTTRNSGFDDDFDFAIFNSTVSYEIEDSRL